MAALRGHLLLIFAALAAGQCLLQDAALLSYMDQRFLSLEVSA